jgi:hypothetical protein
MLRLQKGRQWRGTYDLHFNHHTKLKDLYHSKKTNCGICRVLFEELVKSGAELYDVKEDDPRTIEVRSSLFIPPSREDHLYCLKFKLRYEQLQCERNFVLKEIGKLLSLFTIPHLQAKQIPLNHHLSRRQYPRGRLLMKYSSAPFGGWLDANA